MSLPRAQRPPGPAAASARGSRLASAFLNAHRLRSGWRFLGLAVLLTAGIQAAVLLRPGILRRFPDGLAPITTIVAPGGLISFVILLAALALPALLSVPLVDQRPFESLGWRRHRGMSRDLVFGAAVGAGSALLIQALLAAIGPVTLAPAAGATVSVGSSLLAGALLAAALALRETVLRGCLLSALVEGIGAEPAVVLSALLGGGALFGWHLFALGHPLPWPAIVAVMAEGMLLGQAMRRTRSLWLSWALSLGWNGTLGVVLGFPILAVRMVEAPAPRLVGEALLTGGELGPMGALPAVGGLLLALVAVLLFGPTPDPWTAELWDRHVRGARTRGGR